MKNFTKIFGLVALALGLMLTLPSCKDECKDVTCLNGGTCNEDNGQCDCPNGFSGAQCETEDKCITMAVDCGDHGTCESTTGECICDEGWSGAACDNEDRADYIGNFRMSDSCGVIAPNIYDMVITRSSSSEAEMSISGLLNTSFAVTATADPNEFTISSETLGSYTISGTGTIDTSLDPDVITISISVDDGDQISDNCVIRGFRSN